MPDLITRLRNRAPRPTTSFEQVMLQEKGLAEAERDQDRDHSFTEAFGLAWDNQSISSATERLVDRQVEFEPVPGYDGNSDIEESMQEDFFSDEISELKKEATSDAHFNQLVTWAKEDKARHRKLAEYGVKGIVLEMVAGVLDPVGWGLGLVTGGLGAGVKLGKVGNALRVGLTVAAEAAAMETYITMSDSERNVTDILYAAGGSAILGGTFGFVARSKHLKAAAAADEADKSIHDEVVKIVDGTPSPIDTVLSKQAKQQLADLEAQALPLERGLEDAVRLLNTDSDMEGLILKASDDIGIERSVMKSFLEGKATRDDIIESAAQSGKFKKGALEDITRIKREISEISISPSDAAKRIDPSLRGSSKQKEVINTVNRNKAERSRLQKQIDFLDQQVKSIGRENISREASVLSSSRLGQMLISRLDNKELTELTNQIQMRRFQIVAIKDNIRQVKATNGFIKKHTVLESDAPLSKDISEDVTIKGEEDDFTLNYEVKSDGKVFTTKKKSKSKLPKVKEGGRNTLEDIAEANEVDPIKGPFGLSKDMAVIMDRLMSFVSSKPVRVTVDSLRALNVAGKLVSSTIKKGGQSAFTFIDQSGLPLMRALNFMLLESPQGNFIPEQTASILSKQFTDRIRSAVKNRYSEGFYEWSKARGRGVARAGVDWHQGRTAFDTEVYLKIHDPSRQADEAVTKAAEGLSDGFSLALKLRKENGELGFKYIKDTGTYVPKIFNTSGVLHALQKKSGDHRPLVDLMSLSYQRGGHALDKELADKVAAVQIDRILNNSLSNTDSLSKVIPTKSEITNLIDELSAAGVSDDVIDTFIEGSRMSDLLNNVSNRAKKSLLLDPTVEINDLKMTDFLNTNLSEISDNYFRESGGGAAMARVGFPTMHEAFRVIDAAEGLSLKAGGPKAPADINSISQMLRDSVTMIYGKSIDSNPGSKTNQSLRFARELTSVIRLGQVGFAQLAESARSIGALGFGTVLEAVPGLSIFRRDLGRVGGRSSGELKLPDMREIEDNLWRIGEDDYMTPLNSRYDETGHNMITEGTHSNRLIRLADNALAVGGRINSVMSGFRSIQGGLEKITMRGIKNTLIGMAEGNIGFLNKALTQNAMEEVGWDKAFQDDLFNFIRGNRKSEMFHGRSVRLMNFKEMPIDMRERLTTGMQRLSGRLIQKNFVGDSATWVNTNLGRAISQFRTFGLVSYEKQLIHDLRGDKIQSAQMLAWGAFIGGMTYAVQTHMNSIGEKDPEQFLDERMSLRNWSFGAFNKIPQMAGVSIIGDIAAQFGALPDEMMSGTGRLGFNANRENIPIAGVIRDGKDLVKSWIDLGKSGADRDRDFNYTTTLNKTRALTPLMNMIGTGQMSKAAINALD